jgi:hypothetical protein
LAADRARNPPLLSIPTNHFSFAQARGLASDVAPLKAGNKNDQVDARKLTDLLRAGLLTPGNVREQDVATNAGPY